MLKIVKECPWRVPAVEVQDVGEAIFEDTSDGVVIGQVVVLFKVSVFVEVYCGGVCGEHVQVDSFAVVLGSVRDVVFQAFK